jgi:translocation and assembly module TamB
VVAALVALAIVAAIGGRMYLVSDSGRELVTSFVTGKKISRYGRINVEGLKGDLFDDFTLGRVTVTDANGVWLEATNVHVDWSYWPLLMRRFHATEISADKIRVIRRPLLEPRTEPGGPQAISVAIDKFSANVELMEDFSKEYGRWSLIGDAEIPRKGDKKVNVNAFSLNRKGDHLLLKAVIGKNPEDLRVNLRAGEAQGGPIGLHAPVGQGPLRQGRRAHRRQCGLLGLGPARALRRADRPHRPLWLRHHAGQDPRRLPGRGLDPDR